MDDFPEFFLGTERRTLSRMHEALLERASHVTTSSRVLAESCAPVAREEPVVIENAAAASLFKREGARDRKQFPRPCFGYVGALADWLDYDALARLAERYPEGSVVLIGTRHLRRSEVAIGHDPDDTP